ncbi:MAG: phosphoribosylamine--glycine ligase [Pseudomonadota bacterium]
MVILLLGGGGREHALAASIAESPLCDRLIVAPGNAGIAMLAECRPLAITDPSAVVALARELDAGLVVVGPEAPLAEGVADTLSTAGIPVFGPSRAAAALEASKSFTKEVCDACAAPTAGWARFDAAATARAHIEAAGAPIVVKADGLAAGKGVTVAMTVDDALAAVDALMAEPGAEVVIEEFMTGEEASLFVLADGEVAIPLASAQDHKRAFDGDEGPNTGGMGAYSPAPVLDAVVETRAMETIVRPVLAEMARRGTPFRGLLYAGLMIEGGNPRLVEFNVRFGDPEAQVVLPRLRSDIVPLMMAAGEGRLAETALGWTEAVALTVVLAARGYPGGYAKGEAIGGLAAAAAVEGVRIFHAGTARGTVSGTAAGTGAGEGDILSAGGRVLAVTALGRDLVEARARAYRAVDLIDWPGGFCRRDIGWRALPADADSTGR